MDLLLGLADEFQEGIVRRILAIALSIAVLAVVPATASSQAHAHRMAAIQDSAEVHAIAGGQQFTVQAPADKVFAAVVRHLNLSGRVVDTANKDSGVIATSIEISGGWRQTGKRWIITVVSVSDTETIVRVAATVQKRYKGLQVEPWSGPKIDDKATAAALAELQPAITAELAKK